MLSQTQQATLALWQQVNASLSAYDKLIKAFFDAQTALDASCDDWRQLGLHARHINRHQAKDSTDAFIEQVSTALQQGQYQLLFAHQDSFPQQLYELYDYPPLLFVKGNVTRLHEAQISIVGSRKPTPHAQKISFDMAQYLAQAGYVITSGLAQGVDYQAHLGALTQTDGLLKGRTVGVMGTGIDVCYPRHHHSLFGQIIDEGGCLISELLPQTIANKHTFPRRNRIVAGLSLGTIVTEATIQSGSLITARLTSEQGKQVFAVPSHIDNHNAQGCHHLIREGATLIYHPEQVLEDLRYQQIQPVLTTQTLQAQTPNSQQADVQDTVPEPGPQDLTSQKQRTYTTDSLQTIQPDKIQPTASEQSITKLPLANTELPKHLERLFANIDWTGVDVDKLIDTLKLDTQTVLGQLMELEIMGLIRQQGGHYVRV